VPAGEMGRIGTSGQKLLKQAEWWLDVKWDDTAGVRRHLSTSPAGSRIPAAKPLLTPASHIRLCSSSSFLTLRLLGFHSKLTTCTTSDILTTKTTSAGF
jgi:hypothetical protein